MLAKRYHEILGLRREGLAKYGARTIANMHAAPARISLPRLTFGEPTLPSVRIGPLAIVDNPPIVAFAECAVAAAPVGSIAEIGPGQGALAKHLVKRYGAKIRDYYGIELDPPTDAPYRVVRSLKEIDQPLTCIIASEVIEHVAADVMYEEFIVPAAEGLRPEGAFVVGTPNALAAGSIFRDFSHVQGYAWYDLYAILRLVFREVAAYRTTYIQSVARVLNFVPKRIISPAIELDWCDGIICVATEPTAPGNR